AGASAAAGESRIGARIGGAARTDAASAPRQSPASASATAVGRVFVVCAGYTTCATPAASAIGSPPATRVVFFVATDGTPSWRTVSFEVLFVPFDGAKGAGLEPEPHPARTAAKRSGAARRTRSARYTQITG